MKSFFFRVSIFSILWSNVSAGGANYDNVNDLGQYHKDTGKTNEVHWRDNSPNCGGSRQSPIQIPNDLTPAIERNLFDRLQHYDKTLTVNVDVDTHGTFKMSKQDSWNQTPSVEILNRKYEFLQVHTHCGPEHRIKGCDHTCEAHFVHRMEGSTGYDDLLVIGVFIDDFSELQDAGDLNKECTGGRETIQDIHVDDEGFYSSWDKTLHEITQKLPNDGGSTDHNRRLEGDAPETTYGHFNMHNLALPPLCKEGSHEKCYFAHYTGSLTTPPCTESVNWFVMKEPFYVKHENIEVLRYHSGGEMNYRSVQEINGRTIYDSDFTWDSINQAGCGKFGNVVNKPQFCKNEDKMDEGINVEADAKMDEGINVEADAKYQTFKFVGAIISFFNMFFLTILVVYLFCRGGKNSKKKHGSSGGPKKGNPIATTAYA